VKTVFLPIEIKSRELVGKFALGCLLASRGFNIILGPKDDINSIALRSKQCIYFGHNFSGQYFKLFKVLKERGHAIVCQDEECLATFEPRLFAHIRCDYPTIDLVDLIFTWGDFDQDQVTAEGYDRVVKTGSYRFDMVGFRSGPALSETVAAALRQNAGMPDKYGLFVTSYGAVNHFRYGSKYLEVLVSQGTLKSEASVQAYQKYLQRKHTSFLAALKYLSSWPESNTTLVVRIHPSENPDPYIKAVGVKKNVVLQGSFGITSWLKEADFFIHDYCTSAIEGALLETPGYFFDAGLSSVEREFIVVNSHKLGSRQYLFERPPVGLNQLLNHDELCSSLHKWDAARSSQIISDAIMNANLIEDSKVPFKFIQYAGIMVRQLFQANSESAAYKSHRYQRKDNAQLYKQMLSRIALQHNVKFRERLNGLFEISP